MKKEILSGYLKYFALTTLVVISIYISFKTNKNPERLIWSDMEGYYVYLPSVFIYDGFVKGAVRDTAYLKPYSDTGRIYTKYTCGVALMEMPFFLASHLLSTRLGYEPNGRSLIYCYGLMMAGLFYMWLGLLFLYGYSRRYFEKWPIIIALLCLVLGTNLFYYTFHQAAMSHVYSFCLFSIFLWMVDDVFVQKKYIKNNAIFSWILLGLVFGLIVLIRPTNAILGIIPLYIWVKSEKAKLMFFKQNAIFLAIFTLCIFVPFIPQCLYWKYISGHWFMYSYGHETFTYWKEPKLFRVLFDAWNGWILYSPIVIFPLTFLFVGRNSNRYFERSNIIVLVVATYLFASWWAWWFGGAFGHRSYVEYLAILGLPFAGFINKFCKSKIAMIIFGIVFVLFCYYNIGMTNAYNPPWDGENWTYQSVINEVKKLFYIQ